MSVITHLLFVVNLTPDRPRFCLVEFAQRYASVYFVPGTGAAVVAQQAPD
jgi:hypothetical protein